MQGKILVLYKRNKKKPTAITISSSKVSFALQALTARKANGVTANINRIKRERGRRRKLDEIKCSLGDEKRRN